MSMSALIPIADGSEEMEVAICADLLVRAGISVTLASIGPQPQITAARGLKIEADCLLSDIHNNSFDLIVLPGGMPGAERLQQQAALLTMLQRQAAERRWIGAICAAPAIILHASGLFTGVPMTCHPGFWSQLDDASRVEDRGVVVVAEHKLITAQGPGSSFAFGLSLIEQLCGPERAKQVAKPLCLADAI